ncbi:MAG TPA: type IX secretion system outer membrane channel protein PorV [Tenuifilaceae bacterium]|nr:type IX secretion system outer membrane channel protein PorV [Tenuifilaceae bacterium]
MFRRFFSIFGLISLVLLSNVSKGQFDEDMSLTGGLNALKVAVPFLTIAPDSRAGAMGDVGVATQPDGYSQHWNPAKYPFMDKKWGVAFSYTPWLRKLIPDINLSYLSGYYKIDENQTISGSLLYFSMGEISFTNTESSETVMFFNPNEFSLDFGYSRKFSDYISGALAFRYIRSDLTGGYSQQGQSASKAGTAFAADIAMYYQRPVRLSDKNGEMAFGLNISNIGSKLSYTDDDENKNFIPINMRLGGRLTIDIDQYNSFSVTLDANKLLVPTPPVYGTVGGQNVIIAGKDPNVPIVQGMLQSFNDAPNGMKEEFQEISYSGGIEYWYAKQFAIRGGYFYEHENKGNRKYFTLGAGLKYNIFNFDFAYLIPTGGFNSPMANTVRFSLSFDFTPTRGRGKKG